MAQNEETTPKKQRRTTKKTTKKSTRKSGKGTSTRAAKSKPQNPYVAFDRSQLKEKQRVFQLAKLLDVPSKDLVVALSEMGIVKVAQSSLTKAESEQLLDALAASTAVGAQGEASRAGAKKEAAADADEKIRHRVRKDVENEIHQIEDKVDAELEASDRSKPADDHAQERKEDDAAQVPPASEDSAEAQREDDSGKGEEAADPSAASASDDARPLTNVEPEVTPVPEDEPTAGYAPIFKAPSRSRQRRRASRPQTSDTATRADEERSDEESSPSTEERQARPQSHRGRSAQRTRNNRSRKAAHDAQTQEAGHTEHAGDSEATELIEEPRAIKGSARLEAKRRRRSEKSAEARKRSRIVSQAEFLARRESVERTMVVRERERHDGHGRITQVGVLEDGLLVEHFVTSDEQTTLIGNIYLGRVQNVLPSMEAAFIDIGQGRNGVIYAGEIDWKSAGLGGRSRRIEHALKSGDQVVVQVTKDPVGHKGARLTTQISLAGRYLVYVPGGRSAGISRKLPAPERKRLKEILHNVVPGTGGAIIRTAAEGASEEAIAADVRRLHTQWEAIQEHAEREIESKGAQPVTLYEEPNLLVKVVRDLFNEDFTSLIIDGKRPYNMVHAYVESVAPDLLDRVEKFSTEKHKAADAFGLYRVDEQLRKALSQKVWLPSGGTLIIEHTEALTVIDVNTGKYTGSGGSLEETVTRNNLEAAEEIVRQIRLRDIGGMIVIDFIDMILPENQDLVLRRLKEALGRDRTRHQVSEVTSLGLVQMTRKRLGTGLLETFSEPCECCEGRGLILLDDPVEQMPVHEQGSRPQNAKPKRRRPVGEHPAAKAMHSHSHSTPMADEDIEELAGAVVIEDDDADTQEDTQRAKQSEKPSSSRRRGRRGGGRGRGRGRDGANTHAAEPAQDAPSNAQTGEDSSRDKHRGTASENATSGDSADTSVRDQENAGDRSAPSRRRTRGTRGGRTRRAARSNSASQTEAVEKGAGVEARHEPDTTQDYEQALKEFEDSPRRKRPTRGNSRSDRRPQREDFVVEEKPATTDDRRKETPKGDKHSGTSTDGNAAGSESGENKQQRRSSRGKGGSGTSPRRRRRRAVRRTTTPQPEAQASTEKSDTEKTNGNGSVAAPRKAQKTASVASNKQRAGGGRRGRRRATRRGGA
ncbi:translation initiation factor IF-2 N-terminal domain-containing protein [Corynebacterium sp. HMSC074A01]|uniref:translation initiation factor IF-2 N-terminal domain-containing protein n=1 Tax=Corynebacterium sp. HMSC074A01 TaxID=1715030 RepID=UPI0008A3E85F|nr:translation initiation factor IF-2 N-terminal domain-containing protein [Corynebacterium sp. HMSC074A01]OHF36790.1 hypothetical protein HMPREF2550_06075 [Corynebacterium sp. HMSC074A01]